MEVYEAVACKNTKEINMENCKQIISIAPSGYLIDDSLIQGRSLSKESLPMGFHMDWMTVAKKKSIYCKPVMIM